jgi:PIN domain nuclease of toxin-antitoxin system
VSGYLIDSHVLLWLVDGSRPIPDPAIGVLRSEDSDLYFSVVGVAELCIKSGLGKLSLPQAVERDPQDGFARILDANDVEPLALTLAHAASLRNLPRHHGDPFDRLMIAQAMAEDLTLVTHDRAFAAYDGLRVLWV